MVSLVAFTRMHTIPLSDPQSKSIPYKKQAFQLITNNVIPAKQLMLLML